MSPEYIVPDCLPLFAGTVSFLVAGRSSFFDGYSVVSGENSLGWETILEGEMEMAKRLLGYSKEEIKWCEQHEKNWEEIPSEPLYGDYRSNDYSLVCIF